MSSRNLDGRVLYGISRKSVYFPVLNSEYIAGQMKRIDLPSPVGKQLVGSDRPACYLVYVFSEFAFAENLSQLRILKIAAHDPITG